MISVRNRRPPLSGNNFLAILAALVLLSCNAFKVVSSDKLDKLPESTSEPANKPGTNKPIPTKPTETEIKVKRSLVHFYGEDVMVEPHKTEFKIALILPFHYQAETDAEKRMTEYMLEYYQGVKLALANLELGGFKMKMYVYDDENDIEKLKSILNLPILKSMDIIIGSVGQNQIQLVSDFGLHNAIPVISPITSVDSISAINSMLYCTTPNNLEKGEKVMNFINSNYSKSSVIVVSDDHVASQEMKSIYMEGFKKRNKKAVTYQTTAFNNWSSVLSGSEPTVVILQSRNSTTVTTTLARIYMTKKDVVIIGDNSWSNFQDNDYKFWSKLKVHLVASDYVNDTLASVKNFKINFRLANRTDPGVYAYLGYDQFMFMGEFLMAFGEHFPYYINNREFRYLSSNFHYKYINGLNMNTNVFILKFEDFELKPVQ